MNRLAAGPSGAATSERVFVDSGAWFAVLVPDDADHLAAAAWFSTHAVKLVTSDYVLDEALTLLRVRQQPRHALSLGRWLMEQQTESVIRVTDADLAEAWRIFRDFGDKAWSFTDCTSYAVMQRLSITTAFAFDEHFRQFGTVRVVP